ncbi:MAG: 7-cyano-7-deazaguanine synthase QueC [Pseudomonadales bacterium]
MSESVFKQGSAQEKAVVLLSGGLDSATVLAVARSEGFACHCLSFDYGQKHATELQYAARVAVELGATAHHIASLDTDAFRGSALTDESIAVPDAEAAGDGIPVTYVPARNTVFLAYGLAWAEALGARRLYIGVNAVDYSGYPDCRPEFIAAFEALANLATKAGIEGQRLKVQAPLIKLSKAEIITLGTSLGVDYAMTVSCYRLDEQGAACGTCDSCLLRREGFATAKVPDPTSYQSTP